MVSWDEMMMMVDFHEMMNWWMVVVVNYFQVDHLMLLPPIKNMSNHNLPSHFNQPSHLPSHIIIYHLINHLINHLSLLFCLLISFLFIYLLFIIYLLDREMRWWDGKYRSYLIYHLISWSTISSTISHQSTWLRKSQLWELISDKKMWCDDEMRWRSLFSYHVIYHLIISSSTMSSHYLSLNLPSHDHLNPIWDDEDRVRWYLI